MNRIRECRKAAGMSQAELGNTQNGGRLMLHEYRLKKPIHAEQFDGSKEMLDKYPISMGEDGFGTWYNILTVEGLHSLYEGDWIVSDNGDYLVI